MNIVFFTNHYKTIFFHELSINLVKLGYNIFWISTSNTWTKWLLDEGVDKARILDITEFGSEWSTNRVLTKDEELELKKLEQISGMTINNIILSDRLLRLKPFTYARSCLYVVQREIRTFFEEIKIDFLICEATWSYEILAILVGKDIGCKCFCPGTIRIPGDRFGFFEGLKQESVSFIREPNREDKLQAEEFYEFFIKEKPRPNYMLSGHNTPKIQMEWISKLFLNLKRKINDPKDEMQPSPSFLVKNRLKEVWINYNLNIRGLFVKNINNYKRPYILHTLHKQPESSIDILAAYLSNQLETVKSISRSMPTTHDLYVKEHHVSIGDRSITFYKELINIPGVRLIDPFADSHDLIQNADIIISASGTIAYEAAIYRKHAITLVPMYFGKILSVDGINPHQELLKAKINSCLDKNSDLDLIKSKDEIIEFLTYIISQSFEGIISDPKHNKHCMTADNIGRVTDAIHQLLKQHNEEFDCKSV